MSTYYEFYVGKIINDKYEAVGPYVKREEEYRLIPVLERSRSFITWNEFDAWPLSVEKIADSQMEFFTTEGWQDKERHSIAYYLSYEEILALADDGITQGYVTLEELDEVARSNYDPNALWDIWVRTPEMIAEMDSEERKQYGHIAFVDRYSTGYICRQLINTVDPYDYGADRKELVFIVRIC